MSENTKNTKTSKTAKVTVTDSERALLGAFHKKYNNGFVKHLEVAVRKLMLKNLAAITAACEDHDVDPDAFFESMTKHITDDKKKLAGPRMPGGAIKGGAKRALNSYNIYFQRNKEAIKEKAEADGTKLMTASSQLWNELKADVEAGDEEATAELQACEAAAAKSKATTKADVEKKAKAPKRKPKAPKPKSKKAPCEWDGRSGCKHTGTKTLVDGDEEYKYCSKHFTLKSKKLAKEAAKAQVTFSDSESTEEPPEPKAKKPKSKSKSKQTVPVEAPAEDDKDSSDVDTDALLEEDEPAKKSVELSSSDDE